MNLRVRNLQGESGLNELMPRGDRRGRRGIMSVVSGDFRLWITKPRMETQKLFEREVNRGYPKFPAKRTR